jgi:hypothetical protein
MTKARENKGMPRAAQARRRSINDNPGGLHRKRR